VQQQQAQESGAPLNGPREGGSALLLFCCVRALPRVSPGSSGRSLIPSTPTGWNQPQLQHNQRSLPKRRSPRVTQLVAAQVYSSCKP
jgi:hypothetical protein